MQIENMTISYMTSLFEEITSKEGEQGEQGENHIIGGVSVIFDKDGIDMPKKRFENLVVPIGLQYSNMNIIGGSGLEYIHTGGHTLIDESQFSNLFYFVAKDLGISLGKTRTSNTKKNRR